MTGRAIIQSVARYSRPAAAILLFLAVVVLLATPVITVPVLIPKNYNEGWNAFQALRAMGDGSLYPDRSALVTNNYPPLSFYVVGALGSLNGDNIIAGRLIALFSFVTVAVVIYAITRNISGSRYAGLIGSLVFAGYLAGLHPGYIGMNDPQWLAQAIMIMALMLALSNAKSISHAYLWLVVLIALASGMTKHNLVAFPLAMTIWLLLHDRRGLYVWIAVSSLVLVASFGALYVAYGPEFFQNIFGFHRTYSPDDITRQLKRWAIPLLPLIGAFVAFVFLEPPGRSKHLLVIYTVVAAAWGTYALGGAGVNMNVMYDMMIGLSIVAGLAVHRIGERFGHVCPRGLVEAAAAVLVAGGMLAAVPRQVLAMPATLADLHSHESRVASDVKYIASIEGPVACESLALCYWAHKPFEFDMFAVGQKLESGVLRKDAFNGVIEAHYFKSIQMYGRTTNRLPEFAMESIRRNYDLAPKSGDQTFLLPRTSPARRD
jgi:hypothetical protein